MMIAATAVAIDLRGERLLELLEPPVERLLGG